MNGKRLIHSIKISFTLSLSKGITGVSQQAHQEMIFEKIDHIVNDFLTRAFRVFQDAQVVAAQREHQEIVAG